MYNDLDSYIPSNDIGANQNGVGESNLSLNPSGMNNIYDAEPKDRMHVDTKELHALINRMENMVDEQRLKAAPWELKNDKVIVSKDKKSVVDDEISNPNSSLKSGKSENDVDQHEKIWQMTQKL